MKLEPTRRARGEKGEGAHQPVAADQAALQNRQWPLAPAMRWRQRLQRQRTRVLQSIQNGCTPAPPPSARTGRRLKAGGLPAEGRWRIHRGRVAHASCFLMARPTTAATASTSTAPPDSPVQCHPVTILESRELICVNTTETPAHARHIRYAVGKAHNVRAPFVSHGDPSRYWTALYLRALPATATRKPGASEARRHDDSGATPRSDATTRRRELDASPTPNRKRGSQACVARLPNPPAPCFRDQPPMTPRRAKRVCACSRHAERMPKAMLRPCLGA